MSYSADSQRLLIQILATWVLFAVFAMSAIAFIMTLFGLLKPDPTTKKFLYGVFSVSAVSIFIGVVGNFLRPSPSAVVNDITLNGQKELAAQVADKTTDKAAIVVYTQIASDGGIGQYNALKSTLSGSRYIVPAYERMSAPIGANLIKYCNANNSKDASDLADLLKSKGFNAFKTQKIASCDAAKNQNVLEVWLQGSG